MIAPILSLDAFFLVRQPTESKFGNHYDVLDTQSRRVGILTEARSGPLASSMRLAVGGLPMLPVTLELRDASGSPVLRMSKSWGRSVTSVARGNGRGLGYVRRRWRPRTSRFDLFVDDERVGRVHARGRRGTEFVAVDVKGREIARVGRQWARVDQDCPPVGVERYLVRIHDDAAEPLRSLAIGALLALEGVVPHGD